jgi:hypothetical protein
MPRLNSDDQEMTSANLDTPLRPAGGLHVIGPDSSDRIVLENNRSRTVRPPIVSRMFRASRRFLFAILVGIGGTLAWQSYSDQGMDMVRAKAPSLAEWLPDSTTKPAPAVPPKGAAEAPQQLKAGLAPADQQLTPIAPADAADAAELQQQLEPIRGDLAALRQTTEQLAANQEKMAQSTARLEAIDEAINRRLSSLTSPTPMVHAPLPKPVQHRTQASAQAPSRPLRVAPPPGQ